MHVYTHVTTDVLGQKVRRRFGLVRAYDVLMTREENGERRVQHFATAAEAKDAHDQILERLRAEGFRSGKEDDTLPLEAEHPGLEEEIRAAPDEPEPYLIYADWLQARGDPRGELITLQHLLRFTKQQPLPPFTRIETISRSSARGTERVDMLEAESRIIVRHRHRFLGQLAVEEMRGVDLRWQFGFVRRYVASWSLMTAVTEGAWDRLSPSQGIPPSIATMLSFLRHPSARFMQELELPVGRSASGIRATGEIIAELVSLKLELPLRWLSFSKPFFRGTHVPAELREREGAIIRPLWERFPRLRTVVLPNGLQLSRT